MTRYPLARQGIFHTIQGEGSLLGLPMVFVRLAGCSVGCQQCDTDYGVYERLTALEIAKRVTEVQGSASWTWITGGEPTDHDLEELLEQCQLCGKVALATTGHRTINRIIHLLDFLSVSPHRTPEELNISISEATAIHDLTTQINLVPGLNGLTLNDWSTFNASAFDFRWVTPLYDHIDNQIKNLIDCTGFINEHPGWRLGVQAHKLWNLP